MTSYFNRKANWQMQHEMNGLTLSNMCRLNPSNLRFVELFVSNKKGFFVKNLFGI